VGPRATVDTLETRNFAHNSFVVQPIAWSLPSTLYLLVFSERQNTKCLDHFLKQHACYEEGTGERSDMRVKPSYHETDGSRIKALLYIIYEIQEAFTAFIYVQLLITRTLPPKNVTLRRYFIYESWKTHY
jgi:hypothetical protein